MAKYQQVVFLIIIGVGLLMSGGFAQQNGFLEASQTDPEARTLLNKMSEKIEDWKVISIGFTLDYYAPDGHKMNWTGNMIQEDERYRLDLGDQLIVSDGSYQWLYLKDRNEVQINDLGESGSQLSPAYFLRFHESDDYVYAITANKTDEKGRQLVRIDFKPLDDFLEFAKIGLDFDTSTGFPVRVIALLKNGGRYIFDEISIGKRSDINPNTFMFDASKYPGIYIEDLRLD